MPLLAAAAVTIPPYICAYDQLLLIAPFAWLFRHGFEARLAPWQWALAALPWTLPLAQLVAPLALGALVGSGLVLLVTTVDRTREGWTGAAGDP